MKQDIKCHLLCWESFIMYKNETQKINMEDKILYMEQINILN